MPVYVQDAIEKIYQVSFQFLELCLIYYQYFGAFFIFRLLSAASNSSSVIR